MRILVLDTNIPYANPTARVLLNALAREGDVLFGGIGYELDTSRLDALERRLRSRAEDLLARTRQQLDACARHVRAVHPDRTLARGFAIVRLPGGAALRDAAEAPPDATLHITVDNAVVTARVVSSEPRHAAGAPPPATTDELLRQPARDASNEAPHETTHSTGHTTRHGGPRERD